MIRLGAAALILLAGCGRQMDHLEDDEYPIADLGVIAVLPFVNQTGSSFDAEEFGNILASELVKIGGGRVIRPAQIRLACAPGDTLRSADDAVRLGRRVRADAVLACAITDYDPYDPPKVAVSAQLFRVAAGSMSGRDLDRLLQSGSWRHGPLTLSRDRAGHALAAFEDVYDAHDSNTRRALRGYIRGQVRDDSPFGEREFLAVQPRYLQFVSSQVIHRAMEILASHGS